MLNLSCGVKHLSVLLCMATGKILQEPAVLTLRHDVVLWQG